MNRNPSYSLKIVAVIAIVATGLIHLMTARDAFGDATYKGVLFVANGVGALVAAVGVYHDRDDWGWLLGALVAGGALLGYVLSRPLGLPGLPAGADARLAPFRGAPPPRRIGVFYRLRLDTPPAIPRLPS